MENKNFMVKNMGPITNVVNYDFQGMKGKYFFGQDLGLTGCEGSMACLPAGKSVPFYISINKMKSYILLSKEMAFLLLMMKNFQFKKEV